MTKHTKAQLVVTMLVASIFVGCSNNSNDNNNVQTEAPQEESQALSFPSENYKVESMNVNGNEIIFRAYEQIVYVNNPIDTKYQCMNIYIPEAYFNGESIGKYTMETAPIFLPNGVGGYMPAEPGQPSLKGKISGDASRAGLTSDEGNATEGGTPNAILLALSKGYVVATPGARGRTTQAEDGTYTGKAPAAIVDLKAAVRYLHYNDKNMPGDANKIISNGTSAGGALSFLLGATGNHSDYIPYLEALGAAEANDDIYAVASYCPITNLDHADMAYEWQFNRIKDYTSMVITNVDGKINREQVSGTMTEEQLVYSDELKQGFIEYINSLNLKAVNQDTTLSLDNNGEGSFKEYVKLYVINSAQKAVDSGVDISKDTWLTVKDGKVTDINFEEYIKNLGRSKVAPAFDSIELKNPENILFGTEKVDATHFTGFSLERDKNGGTMAEEKIIRMMNPMNYLGTDGTKMASYWRIRHGEKDSDTALAVPIILATTLEQEGCPVDFSLPWGEGHGGDYDLEELFTWMEEIS